MIASSGCPLWPPGHPRTRARKKRYDSVRLLDRSLGLEIKSAADAATVRARSDWFTGTVWQDPLLEAPDPARVKVVRVTFEPGARTAWHTHPLGQTPRMITGVGRAPTWVVRCARFGRRHGVDPAGRKALARSGTAQRNGSSRHPRAPQWRARGLA